MYKQVSEVLNGFGGLVSQIKNIDEEIKELKEKEDNEMVNNLEISLKKLERDKIISKIRDINGALNALKPENKEILELIYFKKMHYVKIMLKYNIAENTVYQRKYKALKEFKKYYCM